MQIEFRHLKGDNITSLNYKEVMSLENGLTGVREKKMEVHIMFKRNGQILEKNGIILEFQTFMWLYHELKYTNIIWRLYFTS